MWAKAVCVYREDQYTAEHEYCHEGARIRGISKTQEKMQDVITMKQVVKLGGLSLTNVSRRSAQDLLSALVLNTSNQNHHQLWIVGRLKGLHPEVGNCSSVEQPSHSAGA